MARYFVELSARVYYEFDDIEAEDRNEAIDQAIDKADDEIRWDRIDWEVDYVEVLYSDEDEEEQEALF